MIAVGRRCQFRGCPLVSGLTLPPPVLRPRTRGRSCRLTVSDPLLPVTGVFEVDGAVFPATADMSGTVFTYTPTDALADGSHEATFTAVNSLSESDAQGWSFQVDIRPPSQVGNPANGAIISQRSPLIWARVYDNGSPSSWSMTVDGPVQYGALPVSL